MNKSCFTMNNFLVFSTLLLLAASSSATTVESRVVPFVCSINAGCMRGVYMTSYQTGGRFEAFLGIPYALPPVGEMRFSNPKAFTKFSGIYDASKAKADCIQKNYLMPNPEVYGSEDCLYLNVYKPKKPSHTPLPVLVYIHGGGFFSGSAGPQITGPEYFMDTQEVVLVTMAYRLGAMGFLSTDDHNMPGNFGLKDQNLALRWVQKNIAAFNGDPRKVTLFGQSAGAVATHLHVLSRQSEGLFRNIIALSGTANVPFAITEKPLEQARLTAALCNISEAQTLSTVKLARALRQVDAVTLINAGDGLKYWDVDHMTNYRPVVERSNSIGEAFLMEHPQRLLATGNYKSVPTLLGGVPEEGAVRVVAIMENDTLRNSFNADFDHLFQTLLEFPAHFTPSQVTAKTQRVLEEYFNGQHELNNATVQGFLDTITDRGFVHPLFNVVRDYVRTVDTNRAPLYLYRFNYSGPYTYASIYTNAKRKREYGVVHCDDLIYLFRSPLLFTDFERNSTHAQLIKAFVNYFVQFAKNSKPTNEPQLRACNAAAINTVAAAASSDTEFFCDYHEFVNSDTNSFTIKTENKLNLRRMHLWHELLEEFEPNRTSSAEACKCNQTKLW